jgi:hypothetical protein
MQVLPLRADLVGTDSMSGRENSPYAMLFRSGKLGPNSLHPKSTISRSTNYGKGSALGLGCANMLGEQHPRHAELRAHRERAIARLTQSFTRDELGLEEFEERLNRAYASVSTSDLEQLVADLPHGAIVEQAVPSAAMVSPPAVAATHRTLAVLGSVERNGQWSISKSERVVTVLGSVLLDLRGVAFPAGVTTLEVSAVLGSIEIIVPPGLAIDSDGIGILGVFSGVQRVPPDEDSQMSILRIQGRAVLGVVEVRTRPAEPSSQTHAPRLPGR